MSRRDHRSSINHRGGIMNKLLAAVVAATFALTCASGFAKTEEMTKEQRSELHARVDRLSAERAASEHHMNANMKHTAMVKRHHAKKVRKAHAAKHDQPKI